MWVTRIGYALIIGVVVAAAAAIGYVLLPNDASQPPPIEFQAVVNYAQYGVIERIDVKGQTMTVRFRKEYDTKTQFGVDDHVFLSTIPAGKDIEAALTSAGIPVNGDAALQVHKD